MKKVKPVMNYKGVDLYLKKAVYINNERTAFLLIKENGELWDDLTINLPDEKLEDNEIFLNPNLSLDIIKKLFYSGALTNLFFDKSGYKKVSVNHKIIDDYIIDNYTIKAWETDRDRDTGYSCTYDYVFSDFESALKVARKLYEDNNLSSIEIIRDGTEAVYCRDSKSEEFYFKDGTLSCVDKDIADNYISAWTNKEKLPLNIDKLYCNEGNKFMGIDNSTGNCWVEEFDTEKAVQEWLLGKTLMGDYENEL